MILYTSHFYKYKNTHTFKKKYPLALLCGCAPKSKRLRQNEYFSFPPLKRSQISTDAFSEFPVGEFSTQIFPTTRKNIWPDKKCDNLPKGATCDFPRPEMYTCTYNIIYIQVRTYLLEQRCLNFSLCWKTLV